MMRLVAIADIFGKTNAFIEMVSELGKDYLAVDLVDPYDGVSIDFVDETAAYNYFQKNVGLDRYSRALFELLVTKKESACHIIGFSVGASAMWLNSDKAIFHLKTRMTGFYSSQIRNYLHIQPTVDMDLYFPQHEDHFDVLKVMESLENRDSVNCIQTEYLHGFMNKKSSKYNEQAYKKYLKQLRFC